MRFTRVPPSSKARPRRLAGALGGLGPAIDWQWERAGQVGANTAVPTDRDVLILQREVEPDWDAEGVSSTPSYDYLVRASSHEGVIAVRVLRRARRTQVLETPLTVPGTTQVIWRVVGPVERLNADEVYRVEDEAPALGIRHAVARFTLLSEVARALDDLLAKLPVSSIVVP